MEVSTNIQVGGAFESHSRRASTLWHSSYDLIGSGFGQLLVEPGITAGHIGFPISGNEAGQLARLRVSVRGLDAGALSDWSGTLLFL